MERCLDSKEFLEGVKMTMEWVREMDDLIRLTISSIKRALRLVFSHDDGSEKTRKEEIAMSRPLNIKTFDMGRNLHRQRRRPTGVLERGRVTSRSCGVDGEIKYRKRCMADKITYLNHTFCHLHRMHWCLYPRESQMHRVFAALFR